MNCERFELALAGDDPVEREEAERHASNCPACARLLAEEQALERQVAAWKAASPAPRPELRERIAARIAERPSGVLGFRRSPGQSGRRAWMAAAAATIVLFFAAWIALEVAPVDEGDSFEEALIQAENLRRQYAQAIAGLERNAGPVLARAGDPDISAEDAALLLSYRDRLTHLDGVIAEVQGFLEQHPGHSGGNQVLLAAYTEKQEVLSRLLGLRLGETS